ncbi:LrgB family protein [Paraburkholderia phytofirmans]|uniref:LrgB family protein n=1 Tax=Paraburkholderia phytofirmans (strain DSM 17436 / LMG 22146 / PsJN) TaxID=398527 RepID=B2TBA0_PARPJ|nr:LrgB family protein [Paraburkholderia phytofirmans]ACD20842.1 LrgB family protein [Paraburkholderia phytofirmans PsJN]
MITIVTLLSSTVAAYRLNTSIYKRWRGIWSSPLILTPLAIIAILPLAGVSYDTYVASTRPLLWMIGPLTLALAVPVYQQRAFIRHWWPALVVGTIVSGTTAMISAIELAHFFDLPSTIAHSLVARSVSLPFAFVVADEISGARDLTTLFVVVSGLVGIVVGDVLLVLMRLRSAQAHGATLGAIAQVAGVARAHDRGTPNGVMASLTMVFSGAFAVLAAPFLVRFLQ